MRGTEASRLRALPKKKAAFVEPMECLSVSKLLEGSQWLWEIKLNGYRAVAVKSGDDVTLFSRRKKSLNRKFPYIVEPWSLRPRARLWTESWSPPMTAGDPTSICYGISVAKRLAFTMHLLTVVALLI